MHTTDQRDLLAGLFFLVLGLAVALSAFRYGIGTAANPGSGFFPLGLGGLLVLFGAFQLLQALKRRDTPQDPITWHIKALVTVLGAVVLFGLLIEPAGLIIALVVMMLVASFADKDRRWKTTLITTAVITAACVVIFNAALKLTLPLWPDF